MKHLYIIAGCNGAGKTTASYTILPEILSCDEFVNADEIARGISPFKPEREKIQSGRIMLERIKLLIIKDQNFAFETTLATKSFKSIVFDAKENGFKVILIYFYLNSKKLAIKRVETRVKEGGHDIPNDVIKRRYDNGLKNFFNIYKDIVDEWMFIDNSEMSPSRLVAQKNIKEVKIFNKYIWNLLKEKYDEKKD